MDSFTTASDFNSFEAVGTRGTADVLRGVQSNNKVALDVPFTAGSKADCEKCCNSGKRTFLNGLRFGSVRNGTVVGSASSGNVSGVGGHESSGREDQGKERDG